MKSEDAIFLTVSGGSPDYSDDKTDLFDVTGLLRNRFDIIGKYL